MKLQENNFPVQVSGADSGVSQFSIAMNAKAFKVLSDTLYQDKIGSLVREISTNAYDGHIMAGKQEVPFEIHLPDNFEPWFAVKDFGVGLSPDGIRQVFTTYFMSTKDQSNDTVGAFGLGAKTPFAYTDQFTIESNYNSVKTIYSAFIDASGIPNIAEMHSEKTEEGNGVEIKVAVKQDDFYAFNNAVAKQLKYFKVKPIIKNKENFAFENVVEPNQESIIGEGYVVTPSRSELIIIQGQIGYAVDRQKIVTDKLQRDNPGIYRLLTGSLSIRLEVPIGDIGVTASRENIEYDERTVDNILNKLEAVRADIQKNVDKNLSEATCGWDKVLMLSNLYSHFKASVVLSYPNLRSLTYNQGYSINTKDSGYVFYSANKKYGNSSFTRYQLHNISPSKEIAILLVDAARPLTEVLLKVQQDNDQVIIVFIDKKDDVSKIKQKIKDYLLGFDNFYLHSELIEKKVRQKSVIINPKTSYFEIYGPGNFSRAYEKELPDNFLYVQTTRGTITEDSRTLINEFNLIKTLDEFKDICDVKILGIPVSEMKKLKGTKGVKLEDFMKDIKENAPVSQIAVKCRKAVMFSISNCVYSECPSNIRQAVVKSSTPYGKLVSTAVKGMSKYSNYKDKYTSEVASLFCIQSSSTIEEKVAKKALELQSNRLIFKIDNYALRNLKEDELVKLLQVTI